MEFLNNISEDTIIVTNSDNKKELLRELNKIKSLKNIKFMSLTELINNMTTTYDEKSIYYLSKEYNIKPDVAKIYLDNLKYIEDKKYKSSKLIFLKEIKEKLEKENLILKNELFKYELENKNIIIYDYKYLNKYEKKVLKDISSITKVTIINKNYNTYKHVVYRFNTLKEEILFVINKICYLLTNNVDINNIKLANLNNDYYKEIKRVFKLFNIPVELNDNESIYGSYITQEFLNNYNDDLNITIEYLNNKYKENEIVKQIVKICNKYCFIKDNTKKEFIINEIKNTKLKNKKYVNSVKEIELLSSSISDNDYVFLLGMNEGLIPKTYKDEDYITDNIKDEVNLDTTNEINKQEKLKTIEKINSIKNLYLSYKLSSPYAKYYKSSLINEMALEEKEVTKEEISYSKISDELELSSLLDDYIKYGTYKKEMDILYNTYEDIDYNKYDNKYKGINKSLLKEYLNNELTLSYSSLDNYNKCGFKYYLSNILKIDIFDDTYYTFIGSLFHYILEKYYTEKIDVDEYINKYIQDNKITLNNKEKFFLKKLTNELHFIINTIDEQMNYTKLKNILTEEKITISSKLDNISITFKGFVDKILYKEKDGKTIVALIDYKTGNQDIDLSLVPNGLSMQLPIYLYLAKNSKLKNIEFVGFYLQRIINNEITKSDKKSYEEQKLENLKLLGYSTTDEEVLKEFDLTYKNSEVIKSLKQKENNEFYSYSKVLSKNEINNLIKMIDQKIKEASNNIINAKFDINPKIINDENISCKFCKFKDICFVKDKDKIYLEKDKELNYLKQEI